MGMMGSTEPQNCVSKKYNLIRHVRIWAHAILKDISKLPGLGAQTITVLSRISPVLPSVPPFTPRVSWGVPYDRWTVKEKAQGLICKWIFMVCQHYTVIRNPAAVCLPQSSLRRFGFLVRHAPIAENFLALSPIQTGSLVDCLVNRSAPPALHVPQWNMLLPKPREAQPDYVSFCAADKAKCSNGSLRTTPHAPEFEALRCPNHFWQCHWTLTGFICHT